MFQINLNALPSIQVPEILNSMILLEELLIDGNKIKVLPSFLGKFSKLKHLDASFNQLEVICPEIGHCDNLVDLTLSSNDLKVSHDLLLFSRNYQIYNTDIMDPWEHLY